MRHDPPRWAAGRAVVGGIRNKKQPQATPSPKPDTRPANARSRAKRHSAAGSAAEIVADVIFRQKARLLYRRGERVFAEFLAEVAADRGLTTYLKNEVDHFLALDVVGGREMAPVPLALVKAARR